VQRHARRGPKTQLVQTEEDLEGIQRSLQLPPKPNRLPDVAGRPPPGAPGGISEEEIEFIIDDMVPKPSHRHFDPHLDDPLTKGLAIFSENSMRMEHVIACRGCGIPIQTHDPSNVGYVRFGSYIEKWSNKLQRRITCNRCSELARGELKPVVREVLGQFVDEDNPRKGFGGHVVPATLLAKQLKTIRNRRCLVVYILDVLDFNGSFVRNLRTIVGKNPLLVIGTKIDLLPARTEMEKVENWLRFALSKKSLRALDVKLVSSETGRGIHQATNALLELRRGLDVFVVGAANAGKSMFINCLLDTLEERFPSGKVEDCIRPIISDTPGTTLALLPIRAFRRSNTSSVFSQLYDTPGVHQPESMQNLIPIEDYAAIQPTRPFGLQTFRPAKDVISQLRASGEAVTAEAAEAWLRAPLRYFWGAPGADPVACVEVFPPVSSTLQLSFIGVQGLIVRCESEGPRNTDDDDKLPAPKGLSLARICYVDVPEEITLQGDVISDIAIHGLGWVAVSASAVSQAAAGRPPQGSKFTFRVYGPPKLKVKVGTVPMPFVGLPGRLPDLPDQGDGYDLSLDDEEFNRDGAVSEDVAWRGAIPDSPRPRELQEVERPSWEPVQQDRGDPPVLQSTRRQPLRQDIALDEDDDDYFDATVRRQFMQPMLDDDNFPDDDFEEGRMLPDDGFSLRMDGPGPSSVRSGGKQSGRSKGSGPARRAQLGGPYVKERRSEAAFDGSSPSARRTRGERQHRDRGGNDAAQGRPAQAGASSPQKDKAPGPQKKSQRSPSAKSPSIGRGAGARGGLVRRIKT